MQQQVEERIANAFPGSKVDVSIDGNRAVLEVVSDSFVGMSRVQKQQAVYGCIEDLIADGSLHAVSIKALEP